MTAPIGYPEPFGTLLRREPLGLGTAPTGGTSEVGFAPGKVQQPTIDGSTLDQTKPIEGPTFADHLAGFVTGINQTQQSAEHTAEEFAVGHHNDIHGTMIAVEQADISLHLLANVRNRVVDLYREVMRMGS
jgi:flagellar hook-basal body complex protein FliE